MVGLGDVIADLVMKWNMDTYILLRIRILMGLVMSVYYYASGFKVLNMTSHDSQSVLEGLCEALLAYIMGTMQAAPFKNPIFPVWALILVSYRSGLSFLSKYDIGFELVNMLKLCAVVSLSLKHGTESWQIPFWLFWGVMVLKSLFRFVAHCRKSKHLWYGPSSEALHQYMGSNGSNDVEPDPATMEGYNFVIHGEPKQSMMSNHPESLITIGRIWNSMHPINSGYTEIKKVIIAFALARLLRCRLEGAMLHARTISMTRKLMCSLLPKEDDAEKEKKKNVLFDILEKETVFLSHLLHTGFPLVFFQGLVSLFIHVLLCYVKIISYVWLMVAIGKTARHLRGKADVWMTGAAIFSMLLIDQFDIIRFSSSYWMQLLLMCKSPKRSVSSGGSESFRVRYLGSFDLLQFMKRWMKMPDFLDVNIIVGNDQKHMVMDEVIRALEGHMVTNADQVRDLPRGCLPRPRTTSRTTSRTPLYWLACLQLPHCSHVILVLHVATSLCEVQLAKDEGKTTRQLIESKENGRSSLYKKLHGTYTVAYCLSRNCLRLLMFTPKLLPGNILESKRVLQETNQIVLEHFCSQKAYLIAWERTYDEILNLMGVSQQATVQNGQGIKLTGNILQQGTQLAKELMREDSESRWRILAEMWAELVLQISPSSKVDVHGENLVGGMELITLVWALLSHCGIEKSELWPEDEEDGGTSPGASKQRYATTAAVPTAAPPPVGEDGDITEV